MDTEEKPFSTILRILNSNCVVNKISLFEFRPQSFWVIMKNIDNSKIENVGAEFIEASLSGHYDHGKVIMLSKVIATLIATENSI